MAPRRIVLAIVALLAACAVAGVFADRWARGRARFRDGVDGQPHGVDVTLAGSASGEGAEKRYWDLLQKGPVTVPAVVAFLQAHEEVAEAASAEDAHPAAPPPAVDEPTIDAFLARTDLPPGVALLGNYWRGVVKSEPNDDVEREVIHAADGDPPVAYANHLLAHDALTRGHVDAAAERFLREGTYFRERAIDVSLALAHWTEEEDWDRIDRALADPRVAALADPWLELRSAVRRRDLGGIVRVYPRSLRPPLSRGTVALARFSALACGTISARLGGVSVRPGVRFPIYVLAFALGVASVSVTLAFVVLEDVFLKMHETSDPVRDFLFFTFGVGLREEVSKLLFFAPLLPLLRSRRVNGTRLDVLVCGALVGLGFAAEENLGYLHEGDLSTAMARFLTANFFHMSMTAILAGALDRATAPHHDRARTGWGGLGGTGEEGSFDFSRALLVVAGMHGVYDFCLSERKLPNISYLSMLVFFLLTRQFLALVSYARARERAAHPRLLETFSFGMAIVVGASFVYASALVGPGPAAAALAEGLLGLAIIIYIFVQELRRV